MMIQQKFGVRQILLRILKSKLLLYHDKSCHPKIQSPAESWVSRKVTTLEVCTTKFLPFSPNTRYMMSLHSLNHNGRFSLVVRFLSPIDSHWLKKQPSIKKWMPFPYQLKNTKEKIISANWISFKPAQNSEKEAFPCHSAKDIFLQRDLLPENTIWNCYSCANFVTQKVYQIWIIWGDARGLNLSDFRGTSR